MSESLRDRVLEEITAGVWDRPALETRSEFKAALNALFVPLLDAEREKGREAGNLMELVDVLRHDLAAKDAEIAALKNAVESWKTLLQKAERESFAWRITAKAESVHTDATEAEADVRRVQMECAEAKVGALEYELTSLRSENARLRALLTNFPRLPGVLDVPGDEAKNAVLLEWARVYFAWQDSADAALAHRPSLQEAQEPAPDLVRAAQDALGRVLAPHVKGPGVQCMECEEEFPCSTHIRAALALPTPEPPERTVAAAIVAQKQHPGRAQGAAPAPSPKMIEHEFLPHHRDGGLQCVAPTACHVSGCGKLQAAHRAEEK